MGKRTQHQWKADEQEGVDAPADAGRPSRSEMKRQAERLTELGMKLVELNAKALARFDLDDELREAIEACRELKRGNARMRQGRFIGKLLRNRDIEGITFALTQLAGDSREKASLAKVKDDQRVRSATKPPRGRGH